MLLRTSVVDRVNAGLATALTDRADAADLLIEAEALGLFVVRLGSDEGWFRIHPLVRAILLDELTRRSQHLEQHRRAASWLEDAGETSSALNHWLQADEPRDALRLLAGAGGTLVRQRPRSCHSPHGRGDTPRHNRVRCFRTSGLRIRQPFGRSADLRAGGRGGDLVGGALDDRRHRSSPAVDDAVLRRVGGRRLVAHRTTGSRGDRVARSRWHQRSVRQVRLELDRAWCGALRAMERWV